MKSNDYMFTIDKIYWERIFLHIEMKTLCDDEVELRFVRDDGKTTNLELVDFLHYKDRLLFSINIASVADRSFLDNGRWKLIARVRDNDFVCAVSADVAYKLDDLSRIFKYAENQMAYNLSFGVETLDDKNLELYFDSYFMSENKAWRKRRYAKEVRALKNKIKRFLMHLCIILIRGYYHALDMLIPKTGNKIMIMSETKDVLWGNLKYIAEGIKNRALDKKYRVTYSYRSVASKHQGIGDVWSWIKVVTKVAAQDIIFVDDYAPIFGFFKLGKRTKLIQVWHAGVGFKSVGYSRFGKEGSPFPQGSSHKQYTHVITGSEHLVKVYQEVFAIEKEVFYPLGMARLDGFLDEDYINEFKNNFYSKFPNFKDKKTILFAPTYRGAEQKEAYYDYSKLDLARIHDYCIKSNAVFLIKMHPFVKSLMDVPKEYVDTIVEFSDYSNINDLYYITDILVTDYSSSYYEFSLLKRPIIFYTYDRQVYELTRGVHRSIIECAPGKVCNTFDEFIMCLENEDYEIEKTIKFSEENFGDYKGNATDMIIEKILLGEAKK